MTKQGGYHMQGGRGEINCEGGRGEINCEGGRGEINQVKTERRSVVSDSLRPHGLCSLPGSSVH